MGSICFFPKCVPKIRDFVVFPFTRTREFENWWIKSGWVNAIPLSKLPSKILICEEHFEKDLINRRYKVPRLALGALPTRNVECPANTANPSSDGATQNNAQNVKRESYCRLCGQAQTTHISNEPDLLLKLDKIFQHQLHLSDSSKLPVGVCYSCKETANGIQAFWKTCTQAQETLKAIFSKPRVAKCPEPTEAAIATKSIQESSNLEGGIFATKESFPAECEEIVIDTTSTQVTEEQFANEYEFESYCEELPAGTAEESEEVIELTEPDNQLISDDYSIDYGDDSSSEEFTGNLSSSDRGEYRAPVKKDATTPITETKHICEVCGNAFKSLNGLKAHLLVHSERRDHQCTICGHEFKQRRALVEHIESKHERKTFPCKICGMPYSWKKGLQRHMNTHKGNTLKHVCKVCGKAFPVPHKLKLHMMLHTGDRIHCEFCGKGYRFNYMLTQHKIRVHNMVIEGVKLYSTPKQKRLGDRKK